MRRESGEGERNRNRATDTEAEKGKEEESTVGRAESAETVPRRAGELASTL